jgi:signal transduction histidine kinase
MLVSIDPKRITEVMYNLVDNSIKYMDKDGGRITIETEREDKAALIKVKDNGAGISADDIPYVFDKFYRAEKSRSTSIPGSGLGLSICKYIINEHGGEIYCRSNHKQGCEIGFTLI